MSLEALIATLAAVALLIVGMMLRRIEKRLEHIEDLRISDAKQEAHATAIVDRLKVVEVESRKWDEVVAALTELSRQLAGMVERSIRREERRAGEG